MKIGGNEIRITGKCKLGELLQKNDIYMAAQCGGRGVCGKCRIRVVKGELPVTDADRKCFTPDEIEDGVRLACMAEVSPEQDDLEIELRWQEEENIHALGDQTSSDPKEKTAVDASHDFGIAIDIGTTTLALSLVDLDIKEAVDTVTAINHQRSFGADVVSRIQASVEGHKDELQSSIVKDLNSAIDKLVDKYSLPKEKIKRITIAGNTTMQHLLMGYSCETLGVYPFDAVSLKQEDFSVEKVLQRDDLSSATVTMLPGVTTYVGADITAGMYACGFNDIDKPVLLVDLGTNGEMAIGQGDRIMVTSTAAGPAFEGGNISCGMGSIAGAICSVEIDPEDKKPVVKTIEDAPPVGICGTGVVETAAEMVKTEILDESGMLDEDWFDDGYELAENIEFTQKDVRELQLAKSAVRAGMEVLINKFGITASDLGAVYIAGGFGYYLNMEKAAVIGLIPESLLSIVRAAGNTSLKGAILALTDDNALKVMPKIAEEAEEIALASDPMFNELYMDYMMFGDDE
ncbi:MAG: ASKHA domain-containing protein [Lachnospiraceae bacterium]|nr:ASKHA domain-containing protein [Lachnospiraceae bacterium]